MAAYAKTFFQHDTDASHDPKMYALRAQFGWEGIGVFWYTIEAMHNGANGVLLGCLWGGHSHAIGWLPERWEEFVNFCISIGLLHEVEDGITHHRVQETLQTRERAKANGKLGADLRYKKGSHSHPIATLKPDHSHPIASKGKVREELTERTTRVRLPEQLSDVTAHFLMVKSTVEEAEAFYSHYEAQGWKTGNGMVITNWRAKADSWIKNNRERKATNGTRKSGVGDRVATTDVRSYNERISQAIGIDPKGEPSALVPPNAQPLARSTQDRIGTRTDSGDAGDAASGELHSRASGTG